MDNVDHVKRFLRGQNLEQVGRTDEAIELYETVVTGGFDSTGPYDRLIALYSQRAAHPDVIRVIDLALVHVHTYEDKKDWYRRMRSEAERAHASVPAAAPKGSPQPEE
ncbi:MAG: hypothetical protein QOH26_1604 [Actinomycetota bacterium]|nr:hypothetical protein [Actinomycetota bacterium]